MLSFYTVWKIIHFSNPFYSFAQELLSGSLIYNCKIYCFPLSKNCSVFASLQVSSTFPFLYHSSEVAIAGSGFPQISSTLQCCSSQPGHLMFSIFSSNLDISSLLNWLVLPSPAWGSLSLIQKTGRTGTEWSCFLFVVCYHHLFQA